jgi:disulfide bond formation protein DsbB
MFVPRLKVALLGCGLASGAALLVALGSEWWGGLVPCALCLMERWPYRAVLLLSCVGVLLPRRLAWLAAGLVLLALLAAVVTAAVHVGVEQRLWSSPLPQCQAPRYVGGSIAQRLAAMPARPSKACEDPAYLLPGVKLSMAAMNLICALALAAGLAIFLWRTRWSEA